MIQQFFEFILELIVGFIAAAITIVLFQKYIMKRRSYQLLWGIGMLFWAITAFTQAYSLQLGWPVWMYLLYFFSAMALAGFLGAGTLGLITRHRLVFKLYVLFNIVALVALAYALAVVHVNQTELAQIVVGGQALPGAAIGIIAIIINIPALVTFAGGAAYTYIRTWKLYALMITFGAVIPAVGGTLSALAQPWVLPFTDFIGILFLAYGFYLTFKQAPLPQSKKNRIRP
ncbi:MAG TPA: hypothetical protein VL944_02590 [Candidatus Acidoferrum sp.]|nr:hypothetical protein [Candidatus Acidoferrum sp.]